MLVTEEDDSELQFDKIEMRIISVYLNFWWFWNLEPEIALIDLQCINFAGLKN